MQECLSPSEVYAHTAAAEAQLQEQAEWEKAVIDALAILARSGAVKVQYRYPKQLRWIESVLNNHAHIHLPKSKKLRKRDWVEMDGMKITAQ